MRVTNEQRDENEVASANHGGDEETAPFGQLQALAAEVVDLFYIQAFSPGEMCTEADVCEAFSNILLRHWDLCCIITFLHSDDGHLHESAIHTHQHMNEMIARRVATAFAAVVEDEGREYQLWLDEEEKVETSVAARAARRVLADAGLKAGVAVPFQARGTLVGALVAISAFPERLRAALKGLRFLAAPIVIAVGNARRATAMNEQRKQIEHLVEELQRRSSALQEVNLELQRMSRYRSLFLARMSHELRTPLTSILGFAEILLDHEDLTDVQRRFCEKIQSSGFQLQASLNQLVDLSRLEAGQTELFLHEFSLREMLRESCAGVGRLAQKRAVKIECYPGSELSTIVSDEGKLRQVLYNFLAHAISRTPAGGRISVHADTVAPSSFRLEIRDEGEPLLDPAHIFEPVEIDITNEHGTNMNELGLVIAHRLIGVLGGTVKLNSSAPHGLTVMIELPLRPKESLESRP